MELKKLLEENPEITAVFSESESSEPVEMIKTFPSRQEIRRFGRLQENANRKTLAMLRRDAIINMNKKQAQLRKFYNTIVEKQKEEHKRQKDEHRTRHSKSSAPMDDPGSNLTAVSQSGH